MRVLSTNILVNHPAYPKIIATYNAFLKRDGKVNNKKFYETIVLAELPGYKMSNWYKFLKRFKTEAGVVIVSQDAPVIVGVDGKELATTMLSVNDATAKGIALALNIGMDRLKKLFENPELMTAKEAVDLLFKAMKAQDSRIHAVGKVREDNREQEKLDRAFAEASS